MKTDTERRILPRHWEWLGIAALVVGMQVAMLALHPPGLRYHLLMIWTFCTGG